MNLEIQVREARDPPRRSYGCCCQVLGMMALGMCAAMFALVIGG